MSQNTVSKKVQKRQLKKKANNNMIMIVSIVIVLIIVAAFVGISMSSQKPDSSAVQANLAADREQPADPPTPSQKQAPAANAKQYDSVPAMTIGLDKEYFATVTMEKGGEFIIQLFPNKAPITVNSFVFLAREGYFDGTTFHRVLENFMAQGGDPTGTGAGGPGYQFANEDSDLSFDKAGVVAMANAGRDTNGSQFFITFDATPWLDGGYTIFGQVIEGMDVVNSITLRDPQFNPNYTGDVIKSITIEEK